MNNTEKTMDKIVALCKGRGFVYSGSEIYGGLGFRYPDEPDDLGCFRPCRRLL